MEEARRYWETALQGEREQPRSRKEERWGGWCARACSRNWKNTAYWLADGRGEEEEAGSQRGPTAQGLVSLDKDIALYPRTSGKPWQSLKQGRDTVRSVSPTWRWWAMLSVPHGSAALEQHELWVPTGLGSETPALPLLALRPRARLLPPHRHKAADHAPKRC